MKIFNSGTGEGGVPGSLQPGRNQCVANEERKKNRGTYIVANKEWLCHGKGRKAPRLSGPKKGPAIISWAKRGVRRKEKRGPRMRS